MYTKLIEKLELFIQDKKNRKVWPLHFKRKARKSVEKLEWFSNRYMRLKDMLKKIITLPVFMLTNKYLVEDTDEMYNVLE